MLKFLKEKVLRIMTAHPKLGTFGIGPVIIFVTVTSIGMFDNNHNLAFANHSIGGGNGSGGNDMD